VKATIWDWPAFRREGGAPPRLEVARAVWGKVHGAASDFRWIAHSPDIDPREQHLERELLLGFEDAPGPAPCWRAIEGTFHAISCYPSRAVDAARRSGFLEKQVLRWTPPNGMPAALGALLLLPEVARHTDQVWWESSADARWSRPDFALILKPEDAAPVEVSAEALERNAEVGLAAVREAVSEQSLTEFYSALLAERRPVILSGLLRPLPPAALATLLLPLPRELADRLSLAGWFPSKRADSESFQRLWSVLLCDRQPSALRVPESVVSEPGRAAAQALLSGDPSRLGGQPRARAGIAPAGGPQRPAIIQRLLDFAADDDRRWFAPGEMERPIRTLAHCESDLMDCVRTVEVEIGKLDRNDRGGWRREHLTVKADLLRAAALALAPKTAGQVGAYRSRRVPALLYCPRLAEQDSRGLDELGETKLAELVRQSLDCRPDLFGRDIRTWLERWAKRERQTWLTPLLNPPRFQ